MKELSHNILASATEITVSREKKTVQLNLRYSKVIQARFWKELLENFEK